MWIVLLTGTNKDYLMSRLELWGGPECTVNRVGAYFRDQICESGHQDRPSDLDAFASLGLSAIRYPVLWERIAPNDPTVRDWAWTDLRLQRLRELKLRPIAGLVHHGSGPLYTDLLSDGFAPGLGVFAGAVAERYPWIDEWTPVNEPLTTARFSALYGHWYPHMRDERSFWLALLNQIDGIGAAMRAIRIVNSDAKLLQTDDLGRTYATAAVRDQAAFDNVRRWMSWDLLCGRVVPGHPLWKRLCAYGFERRLRTIADAPCPPDTIGVNHYLTSDRFLDHRFRRYPERTRGGNHDRPYADIEAVRVLQPPPSGLEGVLREAWDRYGIPIAVTEAHNGCTREEQMRWLACAWDTASALRQEGVQIRAITAWALLGSFGWNTLLTQTGNYETGVYDVRSGNPKPTALVELLKNLSNARERPPAAQGPGWWRRPMRLHHEAIARPAPLRDHIAGNALVQMSLLLLAGLDEDRRTLLESCCRNRGLAYGIEGAPDIETCKGGATPWALIYVAGADATSTIEACQRLGILMRLCPEELGQIEADRLLDELIDDYAPATRVAA
jgi:dTDP-4-dehydrorhamnose reductase